MALIQNNTTEKAGFLDFQIAAPSKADSGNNFEQVMKSTKDTDYDQQPVEKAANTVTKPDAKEVMKEKLAAVNSKTQDKIAASETEVDTEEVLEAVGVLVADIKELLMEVFQVSEEELNGLMAEMEITDMDLLNPSVIDQLAVGLTGAEDAMELLFQPEFMDTLKNLKQDIENLKAETYAPLQLSEKEVQELLEAEMPEMNKEIVSERKSAVPEVEIVTEETTQTVSATEDKNTVGAKTDNHQSEGMLMNQQAANPVITGLEQAVEEALPEVDAQDIVRQLVERIRVNVAQDASSFEMQLNPEHLGKINLQVVAKNGVVTAQIATENAAVKEALESQLQILKDNLNNQGVKVEAVEVTVASHEFERNLDEKNNQGQEQSSGQKRRFRFDVMEAAEEELTPADALVRDMMLADGNKINYMA